MNYNRTIPVNKKSTCPPEYMNLGKIYVLRKNFIPPDNSSCQFGINDETSSERGICVKIFKNFLSMVLLIFLISCTNENRVKKIDFSVNENFSEPSELILQQQFKLDSNQIRYPTDIRFDSSNNMYVLEYNSLFIKKFDRYGKYINMFNAPFDSSRVSSVNINDDTIYLGFLKKRTILKYDLEGNVIDTLKFENEIPSRLAFLSDNKMIGTFLNNLVKKDEMYIGVDLKLVDSKFHQLKLISSFFGSYFYGQIDPEIPIFSFTVDRPNEKIYIGSSSEKVYKIYVYNTKMSLQYIIDNKLPPVKVSETELQQRKLSSLRFKMPQFKIKEKNFIESMFVDGSGLLWVRRAADAAIYGTDASLHDIFDQKGKYLKTALIHDTPRMGSVVINGDMLYSIDTAGSVLTSYKYHFASVGDIK